MSEVQEKNWLERNSADLTLLSAVALFSSGLYLVGYWMSFGVDILEYMALTDLAKAAVVPVSSALMAIFVGIALQQSSLGDVMPPGGGKDSPLGIWLNARKGLIGRAFIFVIALIAFFDCHEKWLVLGALIPPFLSIALWSQSSVFAGLFPSTQLRSGALILIAAAPFTAYITGQRNAERRMGGVAYQFVVPTAETELREPLHPAVNYLRFIGHAGEIVFLWNPLNKAVSITKLDAKQPIVLMSCPGSPACKPAKAAAQATPAASPVLLMPSVPASIPTAIASAPKSSAPIPTPSAPLVKPAASVPSGVPAVQPWTARTPNLGTVSSPQGHDPPIEQDGRTWREIGRSEANL